MKRIHFYEEGEEAWSMAMELEAFQKESKGEELFKKNEHGKSQLMFSKEGKRALYIGILGLA